MNWGVGRENVEPLSDWPGARVPREMAPMAGNHVLSGVVLAAGRSVRMGKDKALLEVGGVPLWARQRDVLLGSGATEVFLSARPGQEWTRQVRGFAGVVEDALPGGGPLVGITAALERMQSSHLAVVAVDLPTIEPPWFTELARLSGRGCGAIGQLDDRFEPLAAIYPIELRWLAWEALAAGDYSLQRLAARAVGQGLLRIRKIEAGEVAAFANWNTPEDVARASG